VIDWERATGNILKMIIGSIDPGMDGATEVPTSDGGGDRLLSDMEDEGSYSYSPHRISSVSRMSQDTSLMGGHLSFGRANTINVASLSRDPHRARSASGVSHRHHRPTHSDDQADIGLAE
jgi:hypothetical protein